MNYYAGIDTSLGSSSLCVVAASGEIFREAKVASEPAALIAWFLGLGVSLERIGLEAGPLSQWLYAALHGAGLPVELIETRHVRAAFVTMPVKSDRKDARGIAQLMRLGWFRPVHCKSLAAQEVRATLSSRKLVQKKLHDFEMHLRGILRNFGLKVGPTATVDQVLTTSKIAPRELDKVFLTGGSSFVPAVQHLFAERFGKDKLTSADQFESIAYGLALIGQTEDPDQWTVAA